MIIALDHSVYYPDRTAEQQVAGFEWGLLVDQTPQVHLVKTLTLFPLFVPSLPSIRPPRVIFSAPDLNSPSSTPHCTTMSASASHEAQEWPEREPTPGKMDVNTIREALEKNLKRVYREDDHPTDTTTDKPRKISIRFCLRYREVDEAVFDGIIYRPGMSFELNDDSYLRVETITQRRDHEILFHGLRFFMTTDNRVDAYIPKFRGELVWFTHITDPIPIDEIKRVCRIRITNTRLQEWKDHEHLICRLKFTIRDQHIPPPEQNGQPDREPLGAAETFIEWISPEELDLGYGSSSKELRDAWRGAGNTIPFGAAEVPAGVQSVTSQPPRAIEAESSSSMTIDLTQTIEATQAIDLTSDPDPLDVIDLTVTPRAYTFGDAFCGAGGVSCGAQKAGAAIVWAFDRCPRAMDTYRRNFNAPIMENSDVFDFMTNRESDMRVDVAHCSPPCQPFSPAHTVHNQARDEVNSACIFIASNLVTKARPRILTMEETYGLAQRHKEVFSRMILDLVEIGYSVRWAVLECAHYGVPQWRKRLIILAAG